MLGSLASVTEAHARPPHELAHGVLRSLWKRNGQRCGARSTACRIGRKPPSVDDATWIMRHGNVATYATYEQLRQRQASVAAADVCFEPSVRPVRIDRNSRSKPKSHGSLSFAFYPVEQRRPPSAATHLLPLRIGRRRSAAQCSAAAAHSKTKALRSASGSSANRRNARAAVRRSASPSTCNKTDAQHKQSRQGKASLYFRPRQRGTRTVGCGCCCCRGMTCRIDAHEGDERHNRAGVCHQRP